MEINEAVKKLLDKPEPKDLKEKVEFGQQLERFFDKARYNSEVWKWVEGGALYFIDKYDLYDYVFGKQISKKSFFSELGIPYTTASLRIDMWKTYVVQHGFSLDELKDCETYKLGVCVSLLRETNHEEALRIIGLAKRGNLSRSDFMIEAFKKNE